MEGAALCPVALGEREILGRLLEKYLYEFSQYDRSLFGEDGLYGYPYLDAYGREEGRHAFFLRYQGKLAGFVLLNQVQECPHRPMDWSVAEFFVAYPFRRMGLGMWAMGQVFSRFPGDWQIKYHPGNRASAQFWQRVSRHYAGKGPVLQEEGQPYDDGTPSVVLCFSV